MWTGSNKSPDEVDLNPSAVTESCAGLNLVSDRKLVGKETGSHVKELYFSSQYDLTACCPQLLVQTSFTWISGLYFV